MQTLSIPRQSKSRVLPSNDGFARTTCCHSWLQLRATLGPTNMCEEGALKSQRTYQKPKIDSNDTYPDPEPARTHCGHVQSGAVYCMAKVTLKN